MKYQLSLPGPKTKRRAAGLLYNIFQSPEKIFLIIVIPFGLVTLLLIPFRYTPDEPAHLFRAIQISEGELISVSQDGHVGGHIPAQVVNDIKRARLSREPIDNGQTDLPRYINSNSIDFSQKTFQSFPTGAIYAPIAYTPQVAGIILGKIIHPTTGFLTIMAKLANLTLYVILVWLAIKIATHNRWVYTFVALFPIAIQQATALSLDAMMIGGLFICIAVIHNLLLGNRKVTTSDIGLLCLGTSLIACSKPTSLIILGLLLFVTKDKFGSTARQLKVYSLLALLVALLAVGWHLVISTQYNSLAITADITVDPGRQLNALLTTPDRFIGVLNNTYILDNLGGEPISNNILISLYGSFSWFLYELPLWSIFLGYTVLVLLLLRDERTSVSLKPRTLRLYAAASLLVFVLNAISLAFILYLTWTAVGGQQVKGLQGRYYLGFLPLLIPLGLFVQRYIKVSIKHEQIVGGLVAIVAVINLILMEYLTWRWFYNG